ncbi:MAG: hypothetical protein N4A39_14820 [Roseicyclus sp.]|jgi:hypothetical protein|nr:hypothetical protein [Roseicyclus sp.]
MMKRIAAFALAGTLGLAAAMPALAQEGQEEAAPAQTARQLTAAGLLSVGFEIKGMSFVNGAVVMVLQRGTAAYVCETNQNGQSRICVQIQ